MDMVEDELRGSAAIFLDTENVAGWIKEGGLRVLIEGLAHGGPVIVRRAFGDWTEGSIAARQSDLSELGFEFVHAFHPIKGKNSADIQLVVDAMEYASRVRELRRFVIVSGDSDFSPLFRRLRELGKVVVGVGPAGALERSVKSSCNRFVVTDRRPPSNSEDYRVSFDDAVELLQKVLVQHGGGIKSAALKVRMLQIDPGFDETRFGCQRFSDFLRRAGIVSLERRPDNTTYVALHADADSGEVDDDEVSEIDAGLDPIELIAEEYRSSLRKMKWRFVGNATLLDIYRVLSSVEHPMAKSDLVDAIEPLLDPPKERSKINRGLTILFKSNLVTGAGRDELDRLLWSVVDRALGEDEIFDAVDLALSVRVFRACVSGRRQIHKLALTRLLYGAGEGDRVETILAAASAAQEFPA